MIYGLSLRPVRLLAAAAGLVCAWPANAGDKVAISGFADVDFGTVFSFADQASSQSICAFSQSLTTGYSVTATGSGAAGAFLLSSGARTLAYEVLWSDTAGQPGGTALAAGAAKTGFTSAASQKGCNSGPSRSASLTVVIRSAALASARAGSYVGTLQITIAPE